MMARPPREPPTAPPMTPPLDELFCSVDDVSAGEVGVVVLVPVPVPVFAPVPLGEVDAADDVDVVNVVGAEVVLVLVCFGATLIVVIAVGVPINSQPRRVHSHQTKQALDEEAIPHTHLERTPRHSHQYTDPHSAATQDSPR